MRVAATIPSGIGLLVSVTLSHAQPTSRPFHIAPPHASVAPGGSVQFHVAPPTGSGPADRIQFRWVAIGGGGLSHDGLYLAPYQVPAPGVRVRILALRGPKTAVDTAEASVQLEPGDFPGAADCLGQGQTWSATGRDLDYVQVDELPEVLKRVPPDYPPSARARHLSGTVMVMALVCRSGRVIDGRIVWPVDRTPITDLADLALAAVKQWVFKPALLGGQPLATEVGVPVKFPPD